MKPFIQIALTTGHVFELSTTVIAQNRAKCMLEMHPDEFTDLPAALTDTVELFDDAYEIADWAKNNMNPEDYMPFARLVRFNAPEMDFVNSAAWTLHDRNAPVGELTGSEIMRQPVESVLSVMAASGQTCNITVMNAEAGAKPYAAAVLILGPEPVINTYVSALAFVSDHLAADKPAVATH